MPAYIQYTNTQSRDTFLAANISIIARVVTTKTRPKEEKEREHHRRNNNMHTNPPTPITTTGKNKPKTQQIKQRKSYIHNNY